MLKGRNMPLIDDVRNEIICAAKAVYGLDISRMALKIEPAPEKTHGTHGANIGFLLGKTHESEPF
jgi:hypothetical protein